MWQRALARGGFPLFAMPQGLVEVPPPDVGGMVGGISGIGQSSISLAYLFQQLPFRGFLQYPHLMDGDFVQFDEAFALRNSLGDEHRVQVLEIRQTN